MAVRAHGGQVVFTLRNEGRGNANPPLVFPGVKQGETFSYSFWIRVLNNIPATAVIHGGNEGSFVSIQHDGAFWSITGRNGTLALPSYNFAPVQIDRWTLICIAKETNNQFNVYVGVEDPTIPNPWLVPVTLQYVSAPVFDLNFDLFYFQLFTTPNTPVCCFKFWHTNLIITEFQSQAERWMLVERVFCLSGVVPYARQEMYPSIANPYASQYWDHGHGYSSVELLSNLDSYMADPQFLAHESSCPTWVYPILFTQIYVDPGLTPLVTTMYKGTDFFDFADKGSVPAVDFQISSIIFYASTFGGLDPGTPFNEAWGLYKDENGAEISNTTDVQYRLNPGTSGVPIPGPIKATNMYLWKFGGQFKWVPVTPQGPTNTAHMGYMLLLVTYTGYPTGVPSLPAVDLAGLFAINKGGPSIDQYNRGVQKKIPDPTVRTAYIGE